MMTRRRIHRRTMLRGLGTVAIGLPFLEEMFAPTASAAAVAGVPVRAFNVFFGLGIPSPLQGEGFRGVLEPLKPLSDKLLIMRNDSTAASSIPSLTRPSSLLAPILRWGRRRKPAWPATWTAFASMNSDRLKCRR